VAFSLILGVTMLGFCSAGRFIDVEIEVFKPWGLFNLGNWAPIDPRLVSLHIEPLSTADRERLAEDAAHCAQQEPARTPSVCSLLPTLNVYQKRAYTIRPSLGSLYRVRITNLTPSTLGIVLGIDGLNTNGSDPVMETAADKKWIFEPYQTHTLAGWQISEQEALQFRFATPSHTHSPLTEKRGQINVYVYLPDAQDVGVGKGTEAGALIAQPTVKMTFPSATQHPIEKVSIHYARDRVALGITCEETDGPGVRIASVVPGTAAELKGLQTGDVITYANARPIDSCVELRKLIESKSPGDRIVLKVHRPSKTFLVMIELEE